MSDLWFAVSLLCLFSLFGSLIALPFRKTRPRAKWLAPGSAMGLVVSFVLFGLAVDKEENGRDRTKFAGAVKVDPAEQASATDAMQATGEPSPKSARSPTTDLRSSPQREAEERARHEVAAKAAEAERQRLAQEAAAKRVAEEQAQRQADDLQAANSAYRRGDFVTAIRLSRPLADQGNAEAQNNLA
jgi:hypothetical protein